MELSEAFAKARRLMDSYNLKSWELSFDSSQRRFGVCRGHKREISLSYPLVSINDEREVTDTILHEIAHALVGTRHHHDAVWQAKASELGARPVACYSMVDVESAMPWVGVCPANHKHYTVRAPERTQSCAICSKGFDPRYVIKWQFQPGNKEDAMRAALVEAKAKLERSKQGKI